MNWAEDPPVPKKPMTPMKLKPNPVRQIILIGLAIIGIGIGYGMGFVFKSDPPPKPPVTHAQMQSAPIATDPTPSEDVLPQKQLSIAPVAAPVLPESHDGQDTPRAYEEALPPETVQYPPITIPPPVIRPPIEAELHIDTPSDAPTNGDEATGSDLDLSDPAEDTTANSERPMNPIGQIAQWQKNALPVVLTDKPKIAIVIDDMGVDHRRSRLAIELKGPLTLSFLTYAGDLPDQTRLAKEAGHELMLHVPMEPSSRDIDPGPNVLLSGVPPSEITAALNWGFDQFDGFIGINNHMGSRFTSNLEGMRTVMKALKQRELIFLDSVTSGSTKGHQAAIEAGVPFIARNIFLDHIDDIKEIKNRLEEVKRLAEKQGYAVAIGHPRDATIKALQQWLDELKNEDFQLVPISALIHMPNPTETNPQVLSTKEAN